jgi:hypothetical protein
MAMDRTSTSETLTITVHSALEKLLVEQALVVAQELRLATAAAPHGHVLQHAEESVVLHGRELLRRALELATQDYVDQAQKKMLPCEPAPVANASPTKAATRKKP